MNWPPTSGSKLREIRNQLRFRTFQSISIRKNPYETAFFLKRHNIQPGPCGNCGTFLIRRDILTVAIGGKRPAVIRTSYTVSINPPPGKAGPTVGTLVYKTVGKTLVITKQDITLIQKAHWQGRAA
jgi:hypothetical protein